MKMKMKNEYIPGQIVRFYNKNVKCHDMLIAPIGAFAIVLDIHKHHVPSFGQVYKTYKIKFQNGKITNIHEEHLFLESEYEW